MTICAEESITYQATDVLAQSSALHDWALMEGARLVAEQGQALLRVLKLLLPIQPSLVVELDAQAGDQPMLFAKATFHIAHLGAEHEALEARATNTVWNAWQILTHYRPVEQALIAERDANAGDERPEAALNYLSQWRERYLTEHDEPKDEIAFALPQSDGESAEFLELQTQCTGIIGQLDSDALQNIGLIGLAQYRLESPIPADILADTVLPEGETLRAKKTAKKRVKKSLGRRAQDYWTGKRLLSYIGGICLTALVVGFAAWKFWTHRQEFNPDNVSPVLANVAHVYNVQKLYMEDATEALVLASPRVFEHFISDLLRAQQMSLSQVDQAALARIFKFLPNYGKAIRMRRDIYEQAIELSAQRDFPRKPIQHIEVVDEDGALIHQVTVSDLDLTRELAPQVHGHLKREWARCGEMLEMLSLLTRQ